MFEIQSKGISELERVRGKCGRNERTTIENECKVSHSKELASVVAPERATKFEEETPLTSLGDAEVDSRMFIDVAIKGRNVRALIDTGASRS